MAFFGGAENNARRFRPRRDIMRDNSPENDMFFETSPAFGLARSHLADRLGSSVFEDFPARRPMRSFPDTPSFGSLHRHRQHPANWGAAENFGSQESSPTEGNTTRHPFFQRSESIPVRVAHESRHGSRSSTPESTGSGHSHASSSHSRPHSNGPDSVDGNGNNHDEGGGTIPEGVEEHPGVSSKTGRPSFTARRQPKVHHIPIHVEPRDGSQTVVLTPPAEATTTNAKPDLMAVNRDSPAAQRKRVTKQVFAMPSPPNMAGDTANGRRNSGCNDAAEEAVNVPSKEDAPKERVVPVAVVHETDHRRQQQQPVPKAASPPIAVETEVTVTLPVPEEKKSKRKSAEELVEEVRVDVEHQRRCVEEFAGTRGDKQYLYLDEMLTRDLIKLDNISTEGNEELRKARRAVIVAINECIQALEHKVAAAEKIDSSEEPPKDIAEDEAKEDQVQEMDVGKDAVTEEAVIDPTAADQSEQPQVAGGEPEAQEPEMGSGPLEEQPQSADATPEKVPSEENAEDPATKAEDAVPMDTEVSDVAAAVSAPTETVV